MNKTNTVLSLILVVQIILAMVIYWPDTDTEAPAGTLLTNFATDSVTELHITDSNGRKLSLVKKESGEWVLPDYDDYPVLASRVSSLLNKIGTLQTNRLIAQSTTSQRRLKVSEDDFVRLVETRQADGAQHKLYLGNSGGANTIHVRLDDQEQVYLVSNLSSQDATPQLSSWINTTYFSVPSDQVVALRLENANGVFEFTKDGETWTMVGLSDGETFNQDALSTLLNQATALRLSEPIGKESQDSFELDAPQATLTLTLNEPVTPEETPAAEETPTGQAMPDAGILQSQETPTPPQQTSTPEATSTPAPPQFEEKVYTLQIGAKTDDEVVVKSSESEYYVLIAETTAESFTGKTRDNFLVPPPTPTPPPTPAPETSPTPGVFG
jgi:hypothetical protein